MKPIRKIREDNTFEYQFHLLKYRLYSEVVDIKNEEMESLSSINNKNLISFLPGTIHVIVRESEMFEAFTSKNSK